MLNKFFLQIKTALRGQECKVIELCSTITLICAYGKLFLF